MTVVTPLTKTCTNCGGKGSWWAKDARTGEVIVEDGLRCVYECQRCKGTGREPTGMTLESFLDRGMAAQAAVDEIVERHRSGKGEPS